MGTPRDLAQCSVDGCGSPVRSLRAVLCEKHYYRLRRTGTTAKLRAWTRRPKGLACAVDDCATLASEVGFCSAHAARLRRRGSLDAPFIPHAERAFPRGAQHWAWTGEAVGYNAMHSRLSKLWGSARQYPCITCGEPALHWSYTHDDPSELQTDDGVRYSVWPEFYAPRCVPCHKRHDLDLIRARVGTP